MHPLLRKFLADRSGATAIEYALIAFGISVLIIATVQALGTSVRGRYDSVVDAWNGQ